jgi:hypothetical protein
MRHFGYIIIFAALVGVVFGITGRETNRERVHYGLGVFLKFVGISLALAWVLYFIS